MSWNLEDLDGGAPMLLPIDVIDEDPEQPRREFDPATLQELADTIKARGVRQPVSVRRHPNAPDRWILNFGARRLRASKLAGRKDIPVFVDKGLDGYDQVIENEQREALKPLELALFVQRRLVAGDTQAEIARGLGKSRGYLTFVGALIDAPGWLLDVYRSGRCTGITQLYELRKLHETHGAAVERWVVGQGSISRDDVHRLKATLDPETPPPNAETSATPVSTPREAARIEETGLPPSRPMPATDRPAHSPKPSGRIVLHARVKGLDVEVDLKSVPEEDGCVFVLRSGNGGSSRAPVGDLHLLRVSVER